VDRVSSRHSAEITVGYLGRRGLASIFLSGVLAEHFRWGGQADGCVAGGNGNVVVSSCRVPVSAAR
jgi:hypothetical protein